MLCKEHIELCIAKCGAQLVPPTASLRKVRFQFSKKFVPWYSIIFIYIVASNMCNVQSRTLYMYLISRSVVFTLVHCVNFLAIGQFLTKFRGFLCLAPKIYCILKLNVNCQRFYRNFKMRLKYFYLGQYFLCQLL